MIDLNLFRQRIGSYNQSYCSRKVFSKITKSRSFDGIFKSLSLLKYLTKFIVIFTIMFFCGFILTQTVCTTLIQSQRDVILSHFKKMFTGNFYARYVNGNIVSNPKGLKVCHINIRSLKNKINEVKKIISDSEPHILGCSESEDFCICEEIFEI